MRDKPKGHHTVAQIILRYFSPDSANIWQYDKSTGENPKLLPVTSVAKRNNYYTFRNKSGEIDTSLENPFFSEIDGYYPKLITGIKNHKKLDEFHDYLVVLFATQYSRVSAQRRIVKRAMDDLHRQSFAFYKEYLLSEGYEKIAKKYMSFLGKKELSDKESEELKGYIKKAQIKSTQEHHLAGMLASMDVATRVLQASSFWVAEIHTATTEFITSDNPVGSQFFPLTPKLGVASSNMKNIDPEYVSIDEEQVDQLNQKMFDQADRFVFAKDDSVLLKYKKLEG